MINLKHEKEENVVNHHAGPENLQRNQSSVPFGLWKRGPRQATYDKTFEVGQQKITKNPALSLEQLR